jgi:hypothetical protein
MNIAAHVHKTRVFLSDLFCFFKKLPPTAKIEVPYFSQFMSAELVEDFIEGRKELHTDPKWQQSGAGSPKEYEQWTWCDCGITCLKMILATNISQESLLPLVTLSKEATQYGAFKVTDTSISPLHYKEFCIYVREKHGLDARSISALSICALKEQVANGNFVIASVHPSIRHTNSIPQKRGGHLVLIVGYDEKGIYIHNPSGYQSNSSQESAFVPLNDFKRFFAYRGIVITDNKLY